MGAINVLKDSPFLLKGLLRRHTHIWWLTIGSEDVRGRYSNVALYSLKERKIKPCNNQFFPLNKQTLTASNRIQYMINLQNLSLFSKQIIIRLAIVYLVRQ